MWWMTTMALAAQPAGVDLNDLDAWEVAAERIIDLPDGCWEWVGQASWDWDVGRWGKSQGDAAFAGKTVDGVWGEVALQPLGELRRERRGTEARVYSDEPRFAPLVGKLHGARITVARDADDQDEEARAVEENVEAVNVLRRALDRIAADAFTSSAEWDDARGGVVLHRSIPLAEGRSEEIAFDVFFPSGGTIPSQVDLMFPARFATGKLPRWTIRDAEVHLRGVVKGDAVFPSSEAFRFDFGFLGFRFHGAQTIVYKRIRRCQPTISPDSTNATDVDG
jgi:hypothetical protein